MILRKDKTPEDTIDTIQNILKSHKIVVVEKNTIQYGECWSSIRLELRDIRGVGVNGKGCDLETARASAYGEMMERLQGGFLTERLFKKRNPRKVRHMFTVNELADNILKIDIDGDILTRNYKEELMEYDYLREKVGYYHVNSRCDVELPNWFIETNCGTNGLCAGNTKEEALLQGINEIQERYVRKKIFKDEIDIFDIDINSLKHLKSYKQLKSIEEKGYKCFVKDLTCGGVYPVLGLVIVDISMNYYLVSMGADYDMDICLQRCITEVFQGKEFPLLFKYRMIHAFSSDNFFVTSKSLEESKHYQNNVLNGYGAYPFRIFNSYRNNDLYMKAFISKTNTNSELLSFAIQKLLEDKRDIYIKNNCFLGFPAYRVYIKDMSELCNMSSYAIDNLKNYEVFDNLFYRLQKATDEEIACLVDLVLKLLEVPFYTEENIISALTGIPIELNWLGLNIGNVWMFCALCSWKIQNYAMSKKCLERFLLRYKDIKVLMPNYQVFYIMVEYMDTMRTEKEAEEACSQFDINGFAPELISLKKEFNIYPTCPDCIECRWKSDCCYQEWKELNDKLHE